MNFVIISNISQFFEAADQKLRNKRLKNVLRAMNKNHKMDNNLFSQGLVHKDKRASKSLIYSARMYRKKADKAFRMINKRRDPANQKSGSPERSGAGYGPSSSHNNAFWTNLKHAGDERTLAVNSFGIKAKRIGFLAGAIGKSYLASARYNRKASKSPIP